MKIDRIRCAAQRPLRNWTIRAAHIGPTTRRGAMNSTSAAIAKLAIEVITLPVGDIECALRFYVDRAGFTLDGELSLHRYFRANNRISKLEILNSSRYAP
jgi:hypothetical protein